MNTSPTRCNPRDRISAALSIDGPGGHDRFGVFRVFDLSAFPGTGALSPVTARLVNLSGRTLEDENPWGT
jgi:hypothetical protein